MRLVTPACGGRRGFFAVCRLVEGGLGNNYCVLNISLRRGYLASLIAIFCVIACVATAQADVFHRYWIRGPIYEAYVRLGGHGFFGDAIRNEAQLPDGGKFQEFHKDTSIYWHPDADSGIAHQIGGAIRGKWGQLGWEKGRLGYPVTDELSLPNREGKFNHFQNGSIYWSPETGAHVIDGRIREYWKSRGWERSHLGLPTSDPQLAGVELTQQFEKGTVTVVPASISTKPPQHIRPHSSYDMILPILPTDVSIDSLTAHLTPVGLNQHVIRDFGSYFPFAGCSGPLSVGDRCELTTMAGNKETVEVAWIGDTGFGLKTAQGSPEGSGRVVTFEFELMNARESGGNVVHPDSAREMAYSLAPENIPWIGLHVTSTGSIQDASWAGPFNNRRIAQAAWGKLTLNTILKLPSMKTVYLVESIPGLEELIEALNALNRMSAGNSLRAAPARIASPDEPVETEMPAVDRALEQRMVPLAEYSGDPANLIDFDPAIVESKSVPQ